MEFINQVKELRDKTKSSEIRRICENYLSGNSSVSDSVISLIIKENLSVEDPKEKYREIIKTQEIEASRKMAQSLMENWDSSFGNSKPSSSYGAYQDNSKKEETGERALYENLSSLNTNDERTKSFIELQEVKNLGILEAIYQVTTSSVYTHPGVKILCENYSNLIKNKNVPEFSLIHSFVRDLGNFNWDSKVGQILENLKSKADIFEREIEVSKVLESIKNSGSASFYSDLSNSLNLWLVSENKSSGLLAKEISKWSFNPVIRNLVNYLNLNESKDPRKLAIPTKAQSESEVSRVFSPVLFKDDATVFFLGNTILEAADGGLRKMGKNEIDVLPSEYISLVSAFNNQSVKVNENGVFVNFGKKSVRILEESEEVSVYVDKSKLSFRSLGELGKMLTLEFGSYVAANENQSIGNVINLYKGFKNIVELDFSKSISSKIYEGVGVNLIKWEGKIYLQKINETMKENSFYQVNGSQAVKLVKDFLRYDISEGLSDFLEGEQKVKSIMFNDRTKVMENISRVESEISKIESLLESDPSLSESPQIKKAHSILSVELSILREKWNQINNEIEKVESNLTFVEDDILEDQKFNIGDFVKVKESGETGKIISIDGTSGRYTILTDNGKTEDYLVNEIVDLDQALTQASEEEPSKEDEDNDSEEVKESNTHKPTLAKAPGHSKMGSGKNLVLKGSLSFAPGSDKKVNGKVEGKDLIDNKAPKTSGKVDFTGSDEAEEEYEIGYNLREGKHGDLSSTPESGKEAKETQKEALRSIQSKQNLAKAPGKEGDLGFEIDDLHGYNLTESDDLKKK